jgi:two-component system chemotaxis response regulator CheY
MNELVVLVVEDEPEVRDAVVRDLAPLRGSVRIEAADDVADARAAMADVAADGDRVALVLADHRLPGASGVDFLVELHAEPATAATRKVLVTGQADQADTIRAVNDAGLDHYVAKPWDADELVRVARDALTGYVIEQGLDLLRYVRDLDGQRLLDAYARRADDH